MLSLSVRETQMRSQRLKIAASRIVFIALLTSLNGCLTYYANSDHDFGREGERLLHQNYVVTADTPFALATTHLLPIGFGHPYNFGERITVELAAGTVFRTQTIEHYWCDGIDGDYYSLYIVQAIVLNGPNKNARIGIEMGKLIPPPKIAAAPVPDG
jgi:hypothetical protein